MTRLFLSIALMFMVLAVNTPLASASDLQSFPVSTTHPDTDCLWQYGLPPQEAIPHPSVYIETGIEEGFKDLCLGVREEFTLIIGGVTVNGVDDGVYVAIDIEDDVYVIIPEVQNGFVLLIRDDWAKAEFKFRLDQTNTYEWARGHVFVPQSWVSDFGPYKPTALNI